jgi:23S rRNA (adenine1618-N6)-methyltransferase
MRHDVQTAVKVPEGQVEQCDSGHAVDKPGTVKRPPAQQAAEQKTCKRLRPSAHPDNHYMCLAPDFKALAERHADLRQFVRITNERGVLDFTSWHAVHALTRALLLEDFGIRDWRIPEGHLVPAIPNRLNYILWIHDLLKLSSRGALVPPLSCVRFFKHVAGRGQRFVCVGDDVCRGLDIGCGSNLIYPLLGATRFNWHFTAADISPSAIENAQKILQRNPSLQPLIELRACDASPRAVGLPGSAGSVAPHCSHHNSSATAGVQHQEYSQECMRIHGNHTKGSELPQQQLPRHLPSLPDARVGPGPLVTAVRSREVYDFCMCNPPFFSSMSEAKQNSKTDFGGTEGEMMCPGGEQEFVMRMVADSLQLQGVVHWYSTMFGRKTTFKRVRKYINTLKGVTAVRSMELVQSTTARWVLAWSFSVPKALAQVPLRTKLHD